VLRGDKFVVIKSHKFPYNGATLVVGDEWQVVHDLHRSMLPYDVYTLENGCGKTCDVSEEEFVEYFQEMKNE